MFKQLYSCYWGNVSVKNPHLGERSRLGGEMELYNDIITYKFRHSKQINANPRFSVFTGRKDDPKPFIR